jgi:hypothetical protein
MYYVLLGGLFVVSFKKQDEIFINREMGILAWIAQSRHTWVLVSSVNR